MDNVEYNKLGKGQLVITQDGSLYWKNLNNLCIEIKLSQVLEQQMATKRLNKNTSATEDKMVYLLRLKMKNKESNVVLRFYNKQNWDIIKRVVSNAGSAKKSKLTTEQRNQLLNTNTDLQEQYAEMVDKHQLLTAEEFWATKQNIVDEAEAMVLQEMNKVKTSKLLSDFEGKEEVKSNGEKIISYDLDMERMHQIFIHYPVLYTAYQQYVPDKCTEQEFWTLFFRSKYFHGNKSATNTSSSSIFDKFEQDETEKLRKSTIASGGSKNVQHVHPLFNIASTMNDNAVDSSNGSTLSNTKMVQSQISGLPLDQQSSAKGLKDTMDKYNRHAAYVLDYINPIGKFTSKHTTNIPFPIEKTAIEDSIRLQDLETQKESNYIRLALENESRYFQHASNTTSNAANTNQHPIQMIQLTTDNNSIVDAFPKSAFKVLSSIVQISNQDTSSSNLIANTSNADQKSSHHDDFQQLVAKHFDTINELLVHFWSIQVRLESKNPSPTQSTLPQNAQDKLKRIVKVMEDEYEKLSNIRKSLPHEQRNELAPYLKPLENTLNTAFVQYESYVSPRA